MTFFSKDKIIRRTEFARLATVVLLLIAVAVCIAVSAGKLDIYLPEGARGEDYQPEHGLVRIVTDPDDERHITVHAVGRGREFLNSERFGFEYVRILPGGIVYDTINGNFSGWKQIVLLCVIFVFANTALVVLGFVLRCRREMFSYSTLFSGGVMLLWLSISADLLIQLMILRENDVIFSMTYIYTLIKGIGGVFLTFSFPVIIIAVLLLVISNISLIRHEGRSFVNLLGIIISGAITAGYGVGIFVFGNYFASGSEQEMRIFNTLTSLFDTVFVYFLAMLLSASLCGIIAALKKPRYDKTHVIVLGCAIAADGTPLPLLRGRIDRAIRFAEEQSERGGGEVIFVPSGGKGADEVIAEAECMKNYLISQGISEDRILVEDRSATTQENMRFSREKIEAVCKDARIIFSTSGYHVLRSGIISRNAGLDAEGIGSRTKWYFFPNAFVREFIGLLASKWKNHLFLLLFFTLLFASVNMLLPM